MEALVNTYNGRRVLVTGHTGFKGSWLCLWLKALGAQVCGISRDIPTEPSNFKLCGIERMVDNVWADINDYETMKQAIGAFQPEIVFHLAAQPLVLDSYKDPLYTFNTNIMGTANILEAVRTCPSVRAVVAITTDKVYANLECDYAYKETDKLGGYDPYSASKAAAEIVIDSYRSSFFNLSEYGAHHQVLLASARAGNVIGGGDFASFRLIPDCIKSFIKQERVLLRNPTYVRPWQHVLEPLYGYLLLGSKLLVGQKEFAEGWNFGPDKEDAMDVQRVVELLVKRWGQGVGYDVESGMKSHEAKLLMLDNSKAKELLKWFPVWPVKEAIDRIVKWSQVYRDNGDVGEICVNQIREYSEVVKQHG